MRVIRSLRHILWRFVCAALLAALSLNVSAGSRLLATGGVTQIEGAAGGGLSPWAVLAGTASSGEVGLTAMGTRAWLNDYRLSVGGVGLNLHDHLELSLARQRLDLTTLGGELEQTIVGGKLRLFGDLLYHPWGIWSLGVQHKWLEDGALPRAVGATDTRGTDLYLSGSKLWFSAIAGRNLVTNLTLRHSAANQGGLLGYGGDAKDSASLLVEGSLGVFITPNWIIGAEYRQKPDNLSFAEEDDWQSLYSAYFFSKQVSLTAAWLELGSIAGLADQRGGYVSLQFAY
ncbi:Protein of unknown function [Franzmannia pantelleriensis]|uniref:DUF3034 family protein n=1 Tax=Franzmannia pantelleriensis TaxID=48727 RepID=A0A1G9UFN2_9GAMM|nr:DUF3034 family protein [Halomonas pantelleriensis]SDM58731.1 Protein of unknown function [Halomonas pantelleriensis]